MAYFNMAFTGDQSQAIDATDDDSQQPTVSGVKSSPITTTGRPAKPSGSFTFIDFCPEYKRKPNSWFFQADYQSFRLSDNQEWQVKTAETLMYDPVSGFGQGLPFFAGKRIKRNLRGVRLWLVPRLHQQSTPQKIGCINVVPRIKIQNRDSELPGTDCPSQTDTITENESVPKMSSFLLSKPIYESLDEMLERVNQLMANKPINGKILSVETVSIPVETDCWSVDTETSYWSDECLNNNSSVFILRVYFEYGTFNRERLEIIDFVPTVQIWDTPLAVPIYETFSREQSPGLRFISCNTVEVPIDYGFKAQTLKANIDFVNNGIDSRKMFYSRNTANDKSHKVDTNSDNFSLKFLRMVVTRPQDACPESHFPLNREPVVLNCKIFVPTKLPNGLNGSLPDYETISVSKRKIEAWLMTTGARILSAETDIISIQFSSSSIATSVDSCLKSNSDNVLGHYLTIYRIYLDGHYLEPPARLLPLNLYDDSPNQNESCNLM